MKMVLRPGFEPGSGDRESPMLGRTTIGITVINIQCSTGAVGELPVRSAIGLVLNSTNKPFPTKTTHSLWCTEQLSKTTPAVLQKL